MKSEKQTCKIWNRRKKIVKQEEKRKSEKRKEWKNWKEKQKRK